MKSILFISLSLLYVLAVPQNAHAYIDPGTGSLILQALAAAGITALVFIRGIREKIKNFFESFKKNNND